jgi:dienelactone hydrolase
MSTNTFPPCCLKHFTWSATATATTSAVLYIHDALGWTFPNARLLCDHFAKEANVTVYMPDFFGGEELERTALLEGRWGDIDMVGFQKRNSREVREPEIFAAAKELREKYEKLGTVGYCFGGWAVLRLGAKEHGKEKPFVDCVVCAHPSWVTKEDIDNYGNLPIQFLAPEIDGQFPDELKMHAFQTLVRSTCFLTRNTCIILSLE